MAKEIEGIIRQAIAREEDSYALYTKAKEMVKPSHVKGLLGDLAQEELGHKAKLEGLLKGDVERAIAREHREKVVNLRISDYLKPISLDELVDVQDVLLLAMRKEKEAHDFYTRMAELTMGTAKSLFEFLANEELKHKNKVETMYEEIVYQAF